VIEGVSRNITVDGIYVCCDQPLPMGKILRISISPPQYQAIGVTGKVVWSDLYGLGNDQDAFGVGICLVKMTDGDSHYLSELVLSSLKA
jgi:hypothetical protein